MDSIRILNDRRETWREKRSLRSLYEKWYLSIKRALVPGKALEIGGGSGNLKSFSPETICSDIVFVPWLDIVLDAHALPFRNGSMGNIVLFDVLHHLQSPRLFFEEAARVLEPGGRIVMLEPYVSWLSYIPYRFLHQEGMNPHVDPMDGFAGRESKLPFEGNQAVPGLLFEKHRTDFERSFPRLKILHMERTDFFLYPLSGGFHRPDLCPPVLLPIVEKLENRLKRLGRWLAFRLLVVLEKDG